jgi:preprotein translocase subunit SecY
MFIPAALAGLSKSDTSQSIVGAFSNMFGFWYNFIYSFNNCIYFLSTVHTNKMSDDLKKRWFYSRY